MRLDVGTVEFGFSVLDFDYAEFKDDGISTFSKELGKIPGLSFRLAQRHAAWEWEGAASYHYGRVDYIGHTQAGAPHYTRTDEEISDFALRLGRWSDGPLGNYPVMPYVGWGYRIWNRDILPTARVSGLFESYRWNYAWLGAKIVAYQQGASNLMLDVGWIKPIGPIMDIKGAYNNPRLHLKSRDGVRLMLTSSVALPKNTMLILEPYYEYWQLGRSPEVIAAGFTIYEPASKTRNLGVNIRLGRKF